MPLKARFCARCGQPVTERLVDGRTREVCGGCGMIFYRNPLPVAAAVVLDPARRVLLVRRAHEPHRGMWCLPMGFAELEETIAEAALRELREEAGLPGTIAQLLDVDSIVSDFYGDLLVVTFEVHAATLATQAGDDAAEVAWFPLASLPPLAFSSNGKALAACQLAHREEWAIRDSFFHLQTQDGGALLSDALITVLREQAASVAALWLADVQSSRTTRAYRTLEPTELLEGACFALSQFSRWLCGDEADQEVKGFYRRLGQLRRGQGVPLPELLSSLQLFRKNIWLFAHRQGLWERPIEVYRVLELDRRIVAFFDRAIYQAARGYAGAEGQTP